MTNNFVSQKNIINYRGDLKIHTTEGGSLPITTIGDISSSLTNAHVSPSLTSNLFFNWSISWHLLQSLVHKFWFFCVGSTFGEMIATGSKFGCLFPLSSLLSLYSLSPFISCNSATVSFLFEFPGNTNSPSLSVA